MGNPGAALSTFTVIQFSLDTGVDGPPVQRTKSWGMHSSVEAAFTNARCLANLTMHKLRRDKTEHPPVLVDTEWGYDLCVGSVTVHRFWVHESNAGQRLLK
jgi:hypothetical protein